MNLNRASPRGRKLSRGVSQPPRLKINTMKTRHLLLGLILSALLLTFLFRGRPAQGPDDSVVPELTVVPEAPSPTPVRPVTPPPPFVTPGAPALSPEAAALVGEVLQLRALPFHQARGWTNRLALERALIGLRDLGFQAADLPPGILDDPLDFLPAERRSKVDELRIADVTRQINQLDYDLLGEAWQDDDVDRIKALWAEQHEALADALTPEELRAWTARHTWESQILRELPLELSPEEFTGAAVAEYQFAREAEALDLEAPEGFGTLRLRHAERERRLRAALGSDERLADYNRAAAPGYAATQEAAQAQGLSRAEADYVWELNRWADAASATVPPELPPEAAAAALGQLREQLRGAVAASLASPAEWLEELIPALREPTPEEALPSIPPLAPDPLNAPLP